MEWKYTAETNEKPVGYEEVIVYRRVYDTAIKNYICCYDMGIWYPNGKYWELDSETSPYVPDEQIYAWAYIPKVEQGHE